MALSNGDVWQDRKDGCLPILLPSITRSGGLTVPFGSVGYSFGEACADYKAESARSEAWPLCRASQTRRCHRSCRREIRDGEIAGFWQIALLFLLPGPDFAENGRWVPLGFR